MLAIKEDIDFDFITDEGHAAGDVMRNALTQVFVTTGSDNFAGGRGGR